MSDNFSAFEHAAWPVLLVDASARVQRTNKAAIDILAGPLHEGSSSLAQVWSPDNVSKPEEFVRVAADSLSPHTLLKFKTGQGATTSFVTYVSPVQKQNQSWLLLQLFKPQGVSVHSVDGSSLDANAAHKQKLDCALQLARTVALDFNNALTSVLGHASLLLSKADAHHPWRNSLGEIEKSASKAAEIANDLANFSRQEKETSAHPTGNLNVLLQQCVEMFKTPDNAKIAFDLQLERKLFAANFDEAKMQQAFVKILENAVQALPVGGRITLVSRNVEASETFQDRTVRLDAGTYVCVEVSDTGPGILPEHLPRIFEPFFTTKGSEHRGLGLAWVYGIVTNHGGGVAVSSQPQIGTSARIYLPASKKIVKDTALNSDELCGVETVLIVDDEELLLNMGQMVLSSFGYRALVANSGQRALEILNDELVDVVVTDLVMPTMSGRELIEHIRRIAPEMRIICSSGYVRGDSVNEEEAYLQKPFTAQDLVRKVKEVLANS